MRLFDAYLSLSAQVMCMSSLRPMAPRLLLNKRICISLMNESLTLSALLALRRCAKGAPQMSGIPTEKLISVTPALEVARVWPPCMREIAATMANPSPWCSAESIRD